MGSLALLWRSDCPGEAVVKIQGYCAGTKLWLLCGVVPRLLSQWLSSALVGQCYHQFGEVRVCSWLWEVSCCPWFGEVSVCSALGGQRCPWLWEVSCPWLFEASGCLQLWEVRGCAWLWEVSCPWLWEASGCLQLWEVSVCPWLLGVHSLSLVCGVWLLLGLSPQ